MATRTITISNDKGTSTLVNAEVTGTSVTYDNNTKSITGVSKGTSSVKFNLKSSGGSLNYYKTINFKISNNKDKLWNEYVACKNVLESTQKALHTTKMEWHNPVYGDYLVQKVMYIVTYIPYTYPGLFGDYVPLHPGVVMNLSDLDTGITSESYTFSYEHNDLNTNEVTTIPIYITDSSPYVYTSSNTSISNRVVVWYRNGEYEITTVQVYVDNRNDGLFVGYNENTFMDVDITSLQNQLNQHRNMLTIVEEYNNAIKA